MFKEQKIGKIKFTITMYLIFTLKNNKLFLKREKGSSKNKNVVYEERSFGKEGQRSG